MTRNAHPDSRTRGALAGWVIGTLSVVMATASPGVASAEHDETRAECEAVVIRANVKSAWTHVHDTRVTSLRAVDIGRRFAGTADVLIFGESTATVWVRADACPGGVSSSATARRTTSWVAIQEGTAQRVEADSRVRARKQALAAASGQARRELRTIAIRRATRAAVSEALAESSTLADRG